MFIMARNIPTVKEKNIFWISVITSVVVGMIAGLFSGFAVKLINFKNPWVTFGIFIVLGTIILVGVIFMSKQVKKVVKIKKIYKTKKRDKEMKKKISFTIWIVFLVIVGCLISIFLANKFGLIADFKYIEIIIITAVFLTGFGLLALDKSTKIKNNFWAVILPSNKSIILWPMASIIFAFCYLIFSSSLFGNMFFKLSVAFLFFTITFIVLLVLYHDNKYLRELEIKKK